MNDDAPQFNLRSLFIVMTVLMVFIAGLVQVPIVPLAVLSVPCAISLTAALPYLAVRLFALLSDESERTFRSVQLQRLTWAMVVCLFVSGPVIAYAIGWGLRY